MYKRERKETGGGPQPKRPSDATERIITIFEDTPSFTGLSGFDSGELPTIDADDLLSLDTDCIIKEEADCIFKEEKPAKYPNFDLEVANSQGSDLGQEQLDEIEAKAQAKNTKRATEWGLKKFFKWSEKRQISVDLKTIAPKELNEVLRKFYAEVKTEKGQPLTPSALTGIRAAIHRHLTSAPLSRDVNILQDSAFMSANKMFEAKAKLFTKEMNVKPNHKQSIDSGDMEFIE
ncbi:hypothetical protein AC249_AIPGENE16336 [Exaiptasia diaphana]|nr:hypothetical protein AC249_AIPGENE16336 [Exaiptasia diaphana]